MAKNNLIRRVSNGSGQINDYVRFGLLNHIYHCCQKISEHCTECRESYNSFSNKNDKKQWMKGICQYLVFCFKFEFVQL